MNRLVDPAEAGDRKAAAGPLPVVWDEPRRRAAARPAAEATGHTRRPTAPVHETYVRLGGRAVEPRWSDRGSSSPRPTYPPGRGRR